MTAEEYYKHLSIIHQEIDTVTQVFYSYIAVSNLAAEGKFWRVIHRDAVFWDTYLYSLQATFFIGLAKVIEKSGNSWTVGTLSEATFLNKNLFTREALLERAAPRLSNLSSTQLRDFVFGAWEPTPKDLAAIFRPLRVVKTKFEDIYGPIRNCIFTGNLLRSKRERASLIQTGQISDIESMLQTLGDVIRDIWELFMDGKKPSAVRAREDSKTRLLIATNQLLVTLQKGYDRE